MSIRTAQPSTAFSVRLRDLLATVESAAVLGAAEARVRGLGEHLRFACLAMPCSEALVALEIETLGRLRVPVVAANDGFRTVTLDFLASGTPFSYLLGGGAGYAAEIQEGDPSIEALRPALAATPTAGIFVPVRAGDTVLGGAALFVHEGAFSDRHLDMAERLSEVLALTVESFRTERVLFELFARALPDLLEPGAATDLAGALARHIHAMRLTPTYRRRLELAEAVGRLASIGDAEARLAADLLGNIERYAARFDAPRDADERALELGER